MRLLSIDPSLNFSGYAFFEGKQLKESGTIRSKGTSLGEKLGSLVKGIPMTPWSEGTYLDVALIELPPKFTYNRSAKFGKAMNQAAMNKLHMAIGGFAAYFATVGVKVEFIEVGVWKGRQSKEVTISNVKTLYGVEANDHVCDAIMLGHFFLSRQGLYRRIS